MKQATIDLALDEARSAHVAFGFATSNMAACLYDVAEPMPCECARIQNLPPEYCPRCVLKMIAAALEGRR